LYRQHILSITYHQEGLLIHSAPPSPTRKPDWQFIALFSAGFVFLLFLPLLFGGKREDPYFTYKIMWLNYLGHHFKLPLETPKPLFAFLCGIIGHGALYPIICGFSAGTLALLMKLAQKLGKPQWTGFVAFVLFMVGNTMALPEFVMSAYYPMPFIFFTLASVYCFINRWFLATIISLLGAGLLRPEAWLFAPVFILLTMLRKERGFSWWLFVPLIAPVLWALFDEKISGSLTYSRDMTDYYLQTLGIAPVSFQQFWPIAVHSIAATFYLPVHLFGLAGLAYLTVRTKRAEHLLMTILLTLPFVFFWLLSATKPLLFQDRFFAFPMLVCCFYAALFLTEFSRSNWIRGALSAALLCIAFQTNVLVSTAKMVGTDIAIDAARAGTLETIRKMETKADVILCGRSAGYYAYQLGEKASQKIFMFREAETRKAFEQGLSSGLAIFIKDDVAGMDKAFNFLSRPGIYEANGFRFSPVEITPGGNGIVYAFEKLPDTANDRAGEIINKPLEAK
jgi:hypothetical protein